MEDIDIKRTKKPSMMLLISIFIFTIFCAYIGKQCYDVIQITMDETVIQFRKFVLVLCVTAPMLLFRGYICIYSYWKALEYWEERYIREQKERREHFERMFKNV